MNKFKLVISVCIVLADIKNRREQKKSFLNTFSKFKSKLIKTSPYVRILRHHLI